MSVSFFAFQRWQTLWASLNCPSRTSPTSPSLFPSIASPRLSPFLTHSVLGIPPPPHPPPPPPPRQSFALNQKAAAPLAPLPPPSILLITPSAPSPFLLSFHHQPPLPSQNSLSLFTFFLSTPTPLPPLSPPTHTYTQTHTSPSTPLQLASAKGRFCSSLTHALSNKRCVVISLRVWQTAGPVTPRGAMERRGRLFASPLLTADPHVTHDRRGGEWWAAAAWLAGWGDDDGGWKHDGCHRPWPPWCVC